MKTSFETKSDARTMESLVLAWQGRIFDLAFRLLGNRTDAADATQEVFARLFKTLHRLDPRRDPAPWIYRVATNVVRNFARAGRRHRMEGQHVPDFDRPAAPDRLEMEEELRVRLSELPSDELAAVVLHYYHGLSQVEVARVLKVPRTTVQSRLVRALESMRTGLLASGTLASVTELTAVMQASSLMKAPPDLSASLLAMATKAAPAAFTTTTVLGGLIMSKQMICGAVLLGALSLGIGLAVGRSAVFGDDETPELEGSAYVAASAYDTLEKRHDDATRKLRRTESELEDERRRNAAVAAELEALRTAAAAKDAATADEAESEEAAEDAEPRIDWSRFSVLFADNLGLLARTVGNDEEVVFSREEEAAIAAMMGEVMKLTAQARAMAEEPFMDEQILPGLMNALFGESVQLTDAQRGHFEALIGRELASAKAALPADALAIEKYRARIDLIGTMTKGLAGALREDQRSRFDEVEGVAREILNGNYSHARVRLGPEQDAGLDAEIVKHWSLAYSFTDEQSRQASGIAAEYLEAAEDALRRAGRWGSGLGEPTPAMQARLADEMYRLQLAHERRVSAVLTPRQRAEALRRAPRLFTFEYGRGVNTHTHMGPGW